MGRRRSVSQNEKAEIVKLLAAKVQTVEIAKRLKGDHRTIKKYVENINTARKKRSDAGKRKVTSREMRKIKFALAKNPLASSKTIFEQSGIGRPCRKPRCNVMFWTGICGDILIGPFMVEEGVKMDSEAYANLLKQNFFKWYRGQTLSFKRKCIFMQDNDPSHASRYTRNFLASKGFKDAKLMAWPPASPDLNPIENL